MFQSSVSFSKRLPRTQEIKSKIKNPNLDLFLIYDRRLKKKFSKWVDLFPLQLSVQSGEELKTLQSFSKIMEQIGKKAEGRRVCFVAFGGGSVGDFVGFVASVFQRGSELVHVPSTWLSALDSSHGGKTALNLGGFKNQIGTFWNASQTWIVQEALYSQPDIRCQEVVGEIIKTSLLRGDDLWRISKLRKLSAEIIWNYLPDAIEYKYKTVAQDPKETLGHRKILNFGHTLGHVIEAQLGMAHGEAIRFGLCFALGWSRFRNFLSEKDWQACEQSFWFPSSKELKTVFSKLRSPKSFLLRDKKRSGKNSIDFVFLKQPGNPYRENVTADVIVTELERQLENLK